MALSRIRSLFALALSLATLALTGCDSSPAPPATEESRTKSLAAPNHPPDANPKRK